MAPVLSFLLTCCALARAVDDSTALLQMVGTDDRRSAARASSAFTEVLTPAFASDLALMHFLAKRTDFKDKFMKATEELGDQKANSTWPSIPGFGALQKMRETARVSKIGLELVMRTLHEASQDQERMVNETQAAVEVYHGVVGEVLSINNATEQQLDQAKPALLACASVFESGWQRGTDTYKKNARLIQDFYVHGEGSHVPNLNSDVTDQMSPERVDEGMQHYTEGFKAVRDALSPEVKTVEEKRRQFRQAAKAFLKLQYNVDSDQEQILSGKRNGNTKKELQLLRLTMTMVVGKEVLDEVAATIGMLEAIAEQTEEFTDTLAHLITK